MVEQVLRDIRNANPNWQIALLRYFNPVGAHISGLIGEDPCGVPNNLMPFIAQVAVGKRDFLSVYGGDYDTPDGTAKRDYIHVDDLAEGHLAALRTIACNNELITVNLGTGKPVSVLEMIRSFELESDKQITYRIVGRRPGDLPEYYADPSLAKKILGWEARCDLHRMCRDVWRWQSANPLGYSTPDPAMPIMLAA
jgi:UDP-glucose 4-epimerase